MPRSTPLFVSMFIASSLVDMFGVIGGVIIGVIAARLRD